MKTVGSYLRAAREQSGVTTFELSRTTKIKTEFIDAIENEEWEKLPELPVLSGFVKSMADALSVNRDSAVALLRRDYPPKKSFSINPKPDIKKEFKFGPRIIFVILGLVAASVMGIYLFYQYKSFTSAPSLIVVSPLEDEVVTQNKIIVRGTTDTSSVVKVNGQSALVDKEGNFNLEIEVVPETTEVSVKAISRSGLESTLSRRIRVEKK